MANPSRTRPLSLPPLGQDEPPLENIFPNLDRDAKALRTPEGDYDYQAIVRAIIEDMRDFNESYLAANREYAAQLYDGDAPGPVEEGRSSIVMTEVRDLVLSMLPSLVRLFTAQEKPCNFIPRTEADVPMAEEAEDYVNYVFQYDNPGFLILYALLKDSCIKGTGIAKWWTEEEIEVLEQAYRRLSMEQRQFVISQPGVEVVQEIPSQAQMPGQQPGSNVVEPRFDLVIKRTRRTPKHRVDAVPPDEFRISREAKNVATAAGCGHERFVPMSQLISMGYTPEELNEYIGSSKIPPGMSTEEAQLRNPGLLEFSNLGVDTGDPGILYGEWYIRIDQDGDGVPELRKICTLGDGDTIVRDDPVPRARFALFCPDPEPHTAIGHSVSELVEDLQLIKTNILRNTLDSLASSILPRLVVVDTLANLDDALNTELGAVIRAKDINAVKQLETAFVGKDALGVLEYMDGIGQRRTGITEQSKGLDPKALQSTASGGVDLLVAGAQERTELVARILAETGLRDLFRGLLQEVVENPVPERMIRLRGTWTKVTPDQYDATMDVEVNPNIGRGSDRDKLISLMSVKATQEQIITSQGPNNPLCGPTEYRNTLVDILGVAGLKNASRYFKPLTPEALQKAEKDNADKPNPEMVFAMAEADKVKAQTVKTLVDARTKVEQMQMTDDLERDKLATQTILDATEIMGKTGAQADMATIEHEVEKPRDQSPGPGMAGGVPGGAGAGAAAGPLGAAAAQRGPREKVKVSVPQEKSPAAPSPLMHGPVPQIGMPGPGDLSLPPGFGGGPGGPA